MPDLRDVIVQKPWGQEYLCFHNGEVAIWVLEMRTGYRTSVHAHPAKNTALICLQGRVEIAFIRNSVSLTGLDKINVFCGRFHSILAKTNAVLLEIEAPDDKCNLVRLEDDYGRESKGYEGEEHYLPRHGNCLDLNLAYIPAFAGCQMQKWFGPKLPHFGAKTVIVSLKRGLERGLLPPGDAIDGESLHRITSCFPALPDALFLIIKRPET